MAERLESRVYEEQPQINYIKESTKNIRIIISQILNRNDKEIKELLKELKELKIEIQKLNTKINTLISLRNGDLVDEHLEELIHWFQLLLQAKESAENWLSEKIDKLNSEIEILKQQNKELSEKIYQDHLTEVFNRWKFDQVLSKAFESTKNGNYKYLTLALLDLDHFKNLNDTHGHIVWDHALMLVWKLLKKIFEKETSTAIFRYGWEEFAILSRLTQTAIYDKISTFLTQLEKMNLWKSFWWKDVYLTASWWITQMDIHKHFQPSDLVNDADKKLYSSKNNGRNQITL